MKGDSTPKSKSTPSCLNHEKIEAINNIVCNHMFHSHCVTMFIARFCSVLIFTQSCYLL